MWRGGLQHFDMVPGSVWFPPHCCHSPTRLLKVRSSCHSATPTPPQQPSTATGESKHLSDPSLLRYAGPSASPQSPYICHSRHLLPPLIHRHVWAAFSSCGAHPLICSLFMQVSFIRPEFKASSLNGISNPYAVPSPHTVEMCPDISWRTHTRLDCMPLGAGCLSP